MDLRRLRSRNRWLGGSIGVNESAEVSMIQPSEDSRVIAVRVQWTHEGRG